MKVKHTANKDLKLLRNYCKKNGLNRNWKVSKKKDLKSTSSSHCTVDGNCLILEESEFGGSSDVVSFDAI